MQCIDAVYLTCYTCRT